MNCNLQSTNSMVKVSIIIPVYNVANYLRKNIESCLKQSLHEIEIIIVNDGSLDNSKEIIEEYAGQDNRIIPIHKTNEGVTIARNTGLNLATGEYIFFLDGDDYIENTALEKMYIVAREKDADFIIGDFIIEYPDGKQIERNFYDFKELDNIGFLRYCFSYRDFYFTGRLIKRAFFQSINMEVPQEITFGEDNVIMVQLAHQLKKAVKVNIPVLYYVQRNSSVTNELKKEDLKQRANACIFTLNYIQTNHLKNEIGFEIKLFFLNEIYSSAIRGYIDERLLIYLKLPFWEQPYKKFFTYKQKVILLMTLINSKKTILFFKGLKWGKNKVKSFFILSVKNKWSK